jgi:hypothetical protein
MPAVASPKRRLKNLTAHFAEHAPSRRHQNHVGSPSAATPPADLGSSAIAEQSEPPTTYRPLGGLPLQKRQLSPHVNSDSMLFRVATRPFNCLFTSGTTPDQLVQKILFFISALYGWHVACR